MPPQDLDLASKLFQRLERPKSSDFDAALLVASIGATTALEGNLLTSLQDETLTASNKRKKIEVAMQNAKNVSEQLKVKILKQIHPVIHETAMSTLTSR